MDKMGIAKARPEPLPFRGDGGKRFSISRMAARMAAVVFCGLSILSNVEAAPGDVKWRANVRADWLPSLCPSIGPDGTIYVNLPRRVVALNGSTGATLWDFTPDLGGTIGSASSAVGEDGTVYFGTYQRVHALDGMTGNKRWEFQASGEFHFVSSAAIGPEGTVYIGADNFNLGGSLFALDHATGAERWRFTTGGYFHHNSPFIGYDGTVYICSQQSPLLPPSSSPPGYKVHALDGTTGEHKWESPIGIISVQKVSPAIGPDGTLYIPSLDIPTLDFKLFALDGATGKQKWVANFGNTTITSPVVGLDGTVFIGGYFGGPFYALDGTTGTKKWEVNLEINLNYSVMWSPALANDATLYVNSGVERLYALDSTSGARKWEYRDCCSRINFPVVVGSDGTLYLQHGYSPGVPDSFGVLALEGTAPLASAWPGLGSDAQNTRRVRPVAPVFTFHGSRFVLREGKPGKLSVEVFGGPTPQLRWTHNGSEIVGVTNTSLTFETVARADAGIYSVVATNTAGRTTNAPMAVIVSNVEPLRFAGFEWQIDPTGPYALEETQALGASANWQALTNYSGTERTVRFVELNPHPAMRFYRLNGANTSRFTKASIMNGWWFTNAVGSEHLIEYVAEPTGWANWQVLTNLTLPASPYLFIDPESLDKPGRIYRTTQQ